MKTTLRILMATLAVGLSSWICNAQNPAGAYPAGDRAPRQSGQPGAPRAPRSGGLDFTSKPVARDAAEKKILDVLEEMDQQRRGMLSVPRDDGRLLRLLAESIGARNVVEIGTSHGYSAVWMCLALRNTGGHLTTFEIDKERAALARQNFKRAGVEHLITLVEGDAHVEVTKLHDPIDLVFIDADKEGYLDYLNKLLPLVRPGGLLLAHNMTARQADPNFVKAATTNAALDTLFVTAGNDGIAVMLKKR